MYEIKVVRWFSAAHRLPEVSKCERLHGHNWKVTIKLQSPSLAKGFVLDFREVKSKLDALLELFDHKTILWVDDPRIDDFRKVLKANELVVVPFILSCENFARHIFIELKTTLPQLSGVEVEETEGQSCEYNQEP